MPVSRYMPQLDALRVFAVAAVLVHHFMDLQALPFGLGRVNWGIVGVRLFFVLSGFLITGILLRIRPRGDAVDPDRWTGLKNFYARRCVRIFPLYYLVIGIAFALNVGPVRELLPWLLTYTSNIYISFHGEWIHCFSHFWSLAVEEQYYLIWPWVVVFAPRALLVPSAFVLIAIGPAYRYYAVSHTLNIQALRCFTLAALDTLGAGSLLAIVIHSGMPLERVATFLKCVSLPAGLVGVLLCAFMISGPFAGVGTVVFDLALSALFVWLIGSAAIGFRGPAGALLNWKPLVFIGRITYGIYVYHFFLPVAYSFLLPRFGLEPPKAGLFNLLLSSILALAVAALSWFVFERPINNFKQRFS